MSSEIETLDTSNPTPASQPVDVATAREQFAAAALKAGVTVTELHGIHEMRRAAAVLDEVWHTPDGATQTDPALMVAIEEAGGYLTGVNDRRGEVVGAAIGFLRHPRGLHSHIAGMLPGSALRGAGTAVKLHQRLWCLERGITSIHWTFDPLVARNAHLNLVSLGAQAENYLVDVYGPMNDVLNQGSPSDRLLVSWDLTRTEMRRDLPATEGPWLLQNQEGRPVATPPPLPPRTDARPDASPDVLVAVPRDIESLRRRDQQLALDWRFALREALLPPLQAGWRIHGFDSSGNYVLRGRP